MKWQWILWAVYLVVISFVPCSEGDEACINETPVAAVQPATPGEEPCSGDHCSPFCCCFCCQVQCPSEIYNPPAIPFIQKEPITNTGYMESLHPVHCGNIWQPPKITAA